MTTPPRLARALLRLFVPADARDSVEGDLAELHASHALSRGAAYAALWYWLETASFATRFSVDRFRSWARALRSLRGAASHVDLRLSARLLIKYPGLTLISGFGIAAAIGITTGFFAVLSTVIVPKLPLDDGDRVVALENWDISADNEAQQSSRDFVTWRDEMRTVLEVSAFRSISAVLETGPSSGDEITIAGMTASGFPLARVPPLLGRYLEPEDERPGAPPVLVIDQDVWRTRYAGDPAILGRQVRINETLFTIVGVMPAGFGFPVNHQYWTTLRFDPAKVERGQGPELFVFGRLAPGATMESARAELASIGERTAAQFPETNGHLRARVWRYTDPLLDVQGMGPREVWAIHLTISLIVLVVGLNVAILVYARTAVRRSEIVVRTALGASRLRIVGQLFVEALALSLPPAALGIVLAQRGVRLAEQYGVVTSGVTHGRLPFWTDNSVQPATVAYALGLGLIVATIVGVLPALQATRRGIGSSLRQLGGATGMRLGGVWTVLVIAQVAAAIAILPATIGNGFRGSRDAFTRTLFPAEQLMAGTLTVTRAHVAAGDPIPPFGASLDEVVRDLRSNPRVAGVTFVTGAPTGAAWDGGIEAEGLPIIGPMRRGPRPQSVGAEYFDVSGTPLLAGRGFAASDLGDAQQVVIVSRSFVRRVLGGEPAVGRRIRYVQAGASEAVAPPPWFEIVGVVEDLRRNVIDADAIAPMVYHPLAPERLSRATMVVRAKGEIPPTFGATLQATIAARAPDFRLTTPQVGELIDAEANATLRIVGSILLFALLAVLLLSAAGVYALLSFTVSQRRREIGLRAALGASHGRVLAKVLSRVARQIGAGVAVGVGAAILLEYAIGSGMTASSLVIVPGVVLLVVAVGVGAACIAIRRGMSIQPAEALRGD
jgi:putative ABC transport system permease protein